MATALSKSALERRVVRAASTTTINSNNRAASSKPAGPSKPVPAPKKTAAPAPLPKPERVKPVNHHRIPPQDDGVRVVKVGRCHSMSGRSQLTYHVGASPEGEVMFRIHANSAAGFFSQEWVPLKDIEKTLSNKDRAGALTSFLLHTLYRGKSVNTPGFLLAVLKAEGMVRPSSTVKRCFELTDPAAFSARMRALAKGSAQSETDGATPTAKDGTPKKASGGAPGKKVAAPSKKKTASASRK